jgi:hypothetical protein
MPKIKTSELEGLALNYAVDICLGKQDEPYRPNYANSWTHAGPIIEREGIEVKKGNPLYFPKGNENSDYYEPLWVAGKQHGGTPLIAAMRCYVASKLGDVVDIPDELV